MVYVNEIKYISKSVVIKNGKVILDDGKDATPIEKEINIRVEGDVETLSADACMRIDVSGNVTNGLKTMSGDVRVDGDVSGDVKTMAGDVRVGKSVGGKIKTLSGDVNVGGN